MQRNARLSLVLALAATWSVIGARAAEASSAFAYDRGTLVAVHESGGVVRDAAIRASLSCPDDIPYEWASHLRIVPRVPARFENQGYLLRLPSRGRTLRHRVFARYGTRREHDIFRGTIELTPGASATRLRLRLRSESRDPDFRCSTDVEHLVDASDGQVYAGHTTDNEPVVLLRHGTIVEWLSGFGLPCTSQGFIEGVHEDALVTTAQGAFGSPEPVNGFSDADVDRAVLLQGAFTGTSAVGRVRITGRRDFQVCRQPTLRWEARA